MLAMTAGARRSRSSRPRPTASTRLRLRPPWMTRRRGTRMAARSEASGGGLKSAGVQRVVGVVALVVTALAIGAVRMGFIHLPGSHDDESVLAKSSESAPTSKPAPNGPAGTPDAINLDAPAAEPLDSPQA